MKHLFLLNVVAFAERCHRAQVRKYTAEPYIVHPLEVASIVATVTDDENVIAAALLHDVVEDCGITFQQITRAFNKEVMQLVHEVTDVSRKEHGNRTVRKTLDREHIARASPNGKTIKLADLISNTHSIVRHDPDFAKVYLSEKRELLKVLKEGNRTLYYRASALVEDYEQMLA